MLDLFLNISMLCLVLTFEHTLACTAYAIVLGCRTQTHVQHNKGAFTKKIKLHDIQNAQILS